MSLCGRSCLMSRGPQPGFQPASPGWHQGGEGKLLGARSLRAVGIGPGGGRRKGERFKPTAEMGENAGAWRPLQGRSQMGAAKGPSWLGDLGSTHKQSLGLKPPKVAREKRRKAAGTVTLSQGEDNGAGPGNELCVGLLSAAHLSWIY